MTSNIFNIWKIYEYKKFNVFIEKIDVIIENVNEFINYL